jgi:general secretion pathway protein H
MPTSATGNDRHAGRAVSDRSGARSGFTYIELLIALFLIGLFVSLALLSLPGESPADRLQREAERLYVRMNLAREEAVLQARTLGLRIDDEGYRFLHLRSERWQALADDRLLPAHALPDSVQLSLDLDGIEVSLDDDGDEEETEDERPPPQIYFLAGGEIVPPFQLRLRGDGTEVEFVIQPGDEEWLTLVESGE